MDDREQDIAKLRDLCFKIQLSTGKERKDWERQFECALRKSERKRNNERKIRNGKSAPNGRRKKPNGRI